ncbi:MAG TPA: helix-turn-helix transcriptional regulator [Casimicrobiaceae bacterium]|nr:helix-turn-helix transcriptional regulator [Casimicrobiaceae bacterium]
MPRRSHLPTSNAAAKPFMRGEGGATEPKGDRADAHFVAELGARIRALRERQRVSRKRLAHESKISERYLAQIESGRANISVVLLRRVAETLGVGIAQLVAANAVGGAARRNRIALIGMRGAGKSTLGAMLADALRIPLVELNREVAREAGLPAGEVMALYGHAAYRRIEQRVFERVAREQAHAVIVAGGGIVNEEAAFDLLLASCYTVWIKARPEEHMARVLAQGDLRPMAGNARAMDDLKRILAGRESMYRKADVVIDTSGETPRQSFVKLRAAVAPAFDSHALQPEMAR